MTIGSGEDCILDNLNPARTVVDATTSLVFHACDSVMPLKRITKAKKKSVYRNEERSPERCLRLRRMIIRVRRRNTKVPVVQSEDIRNTKKKLKLTISSSMK